MSLIKRIPGIIGTTVFMILFFLFYSVYNTDTFRNFLIIEAIAGTILILFIFNPTTKRVKYAFLAGVATSICAFVLSASGTYIGWFLFFGGRIRILGVPVEIIIWTFFFGVMGALLSESPKFLRKIGSPIMKIFDKVEHSDKLFGPVIMLMIAGFGTLIDYYSTRYGAFFPAPYWSFGFTFCVWLAIAFTTIITYNYLKMPYEFMQQKNQKILEE
ncbi:MAG: hypothetical protein ACTSR3_13190 [Candidatus Helarchaeota archaeon]